MCCRLVKDKGTQKLKGTAFVEYERLEDAQRAADACAKARSAPVLFQVHIVEASSPKSMSELALRVLYTRSVIYPKAANSAGSLQSFALQLSSALRKLLQSVLQNERSSCEACHVNKA